MPTVTGAWAPNGSTNQRMRLSVEYAVSTPGPGDTSVTVSGTVRLHAGYSFYHNGALFNRWGTLIGSTIEDDSINVNVPTNGSQVIFTFNRPAGIGTSPSSLSFGFSVRGISYVGSGTIANVTGNIPLPARTSYPTPTNVDLSWPGSGDDMTLSWDGGPVHAIEYRLSEPAGSLWNYGAWIPWSSIERSSPQTLSFPQGYQRQVRVRRGSGAGASGWNNSNSVAQFLEPNAPTGLAVTYQSDSRRTLTWDITVPAWRPVDHFEIIKYQAFSDRWVTVATVTGGARSWVDAAYNPNDRLNYHVIAVNGVGRAQSGTSAVPSLLRTTPESPTSVAATRTGPAAALVTWQSPNLRAASSFTIQAQTSADLGVSWSAWADMSGHTGISTVARSRALSSLNASLWYRFRVVAVANNNPPNPTLYGYSAASGIIKPAAKPNPPTLLAPSGIVSVAEDVLFRWRHNATDGSDQTAYELRYRPLGGSWTTLSGSLTAVQERAVSLPDAGVYEAQVRTKGQHADWSDWSPVGAFEALDPPVATITSPTDAGTETSNRATIIWDYADVTGSIQTRWRVELLDAGGDLIEQKAGSDARTTVTFDALLDNLTTYQARLWVASGTGLESAMATVTWSTDFLPPVAPDLVANWLDSEGLVRLTVANHPGDGVATVDTAHNRVERSTDLGQTWVVLGDNLPLDVGMDDPLVPLSTIVWFRAVAVGELGTEAATDPPIEVETRSSRVWLTGEDGATLMVLANPSLDYSDGHERVSEVYYGRSHPTPHYGEGRPVTIGVSGDLLHDMGYGQEVTRLLAQDVFYRDPYGRAFWASVTDGFSRGMDSGGHQRQSISFTVEQVHVEA